MSSLFALRTLLLAAECLAASVLLPSLAWLATRFLRDASLRHLAWLTAFGTLLVFPVASLVVPPGIVLERAVQVAHPSIPMMIAPTVEAAAPETIPPEAFPLSGLTLDEVAVAAFVLWLAGVCWASSRLMAGALGLHLLRRRSRPHALVSDDVPKIATRGRECELRLSAEQDGPMTWGLLRPVILLPRTALGWTRERTQAVLLHELAHVRRRDSLTQSLSLLICAFYWPNPMVWLAARALRREAEIAADDAVLGSGMKPSAYAGELLQLASEFRGHGLAVSGVSMASGSSLEMRVKSVLACDRLRTGATSMDILKLACLGLIATATLAVARPDIVDAQSTTPPRDPAVASAPLPPPPPVAPSPSGVPTPPEAPAVADVPVPPEPATPAIQASPAARPDHVVHVHVIRRRHGAPADQDININQVEIDAAMDQARQAQDQLRRLEPEIRKAIAAAKIDERVVKAMQDAEPRIRADMARAIARAQPAIRQAIADAHISERVAKALKDAQPRIDAAIAKAREAQRHVRVEVDSHDDEAADQDMQDEQEDQRDEQ
jgi:beta-lactamase regulating signal transducer with metallopeptidase domain